MDERDGEEVGVNDGLSVMEAVCFAVVVTVEKQIIDLKMNPQWWAAFQVFVKNGTNPGKPRIRQDVTSAIIFKKSLFLSPIPQSTHRGGENELMAPALDPQLS